MSLSTSSFLGVILDNPPTPSGKHEFIGSSSLVNAFERYEDSKLDKTFKIAKLSEFFKKSVPKCPLTSAIRLKKS